MTTSRMLLWIVMCLAAGVILYVIQMPVRRSQGKWMKRLRVLLLPVKALLSALQAYLTISLSIGIIWRHPYIFGAAYVAVTADVFAEILCLLIRNKKVYPVAAAVLTIFYLAFGTINSQIISPIERTYSSDKLQNTYKIVFLSDVHYGSSQFPSTVRNTMEKIKAEKPDYLLLGGDIVDEHTTKAQMEELFSMIKDLGLETYYIYGNHDQQDHAHLVGGHTYTKEELDHAIESNGITILCNDVLKLEDDLTIIGIDDASHPDTRLAADKLPGSDPDTYRIFLDHSPYQTQDTKKLGADLQLSGHTHAGQFIPLRLIYQFAVPAIDGDYQIGDTLVHVSSGFGGWYYPFRTEMQCEYSVINLSPTQ